MLIFPNFLSLWRHSKRFEPSKPLMMILTIVLIAAATVAIVGAQETEIAADHPAVQCVPIYHTITIPGAGVKTSLFVEGSVTSSKHTTTGLRLKFKGVEVGLDREQIKQRSAIMSAEVPIHYWVANGTYRGLQGLIIGEKWVSTYNKDEVRDIVNLLSATPEMGEVLSQSRKMIDTVDKMLDKL